VGDLLRSWLRHWLGIDDLTSRVDGHDVAAVVQGRSLGQLRRECGEIRLIARQLDPMNRPPWVRGDDRPYSDDERAARVDNVLGADPNREPA
jgi:hypothetical protein